MPQSNYSRQPLIGTKAGSDYSSGDTILNLTKTPPV